jgi:predicted membrane protein
MSYVGLCAIFGLVLAFCVFTTSKRSLAATAAVNAGVGLIAIWQGFSELGPTSGG